LHLGDHLVEVVARVFTELLAHLAHPARHSLRVVLVEVAERRGVAEIVQPVIFGANQGEPRHQARELPAAASLALRFDLLAHAQRQDRRFPAAIGAAVLVNWHEETIITPISCGTTPEGWGWSRPRLRRGRATGSGGIGGAERGGAARAPDGPPESFGRLGREPAFAEGQERPLAIHHGLEGHVAAPQPVEVAEALLGVLELEIAPVMSVNEEEGAVVVVVGVLDPDDGNPPHADVL